MDTDPAFASLEAFACALTRDIADMSLAVVEMVTGAADAPAPLPPAPNALADAPPPAARERVDYAALLRGRVLVVGDGDFGFAAAIARALPDAARLTATAFDASPDDGGRCAHLSARGARVRRDVERQRANHPRRAPRKDL